MPLQSGNFGNIVIKIGNNYYATSEPDSGIAIPVANLSLIGSSVRLNPVAVDLRRANTSIASFSFALTDHNESITMLLRDNPTYFIFTRVEVWIGRVGENFDFSRYLKLPPFTITGVKHDAVRFDFTCSSEDQRLTRPLFNTSAILNANIVADSTRIQIDTTDFPDSGLVKIGSEFITYNTKNADSLIVSSVERGSLATTPSDHAAGSVVELVRKVEGNPIDLLFEFLTDYVGIPEADIDKTNFDLVKTNHFPNATFRFYLYGIQNALNFIQTEILQSTNTRIISSGSSKISLAILDQISSAIVSPRVISDASMRFKGIQVRYSNLVNRIKIDYDFDEANRNYKFSKTFIDQQSINIYGETTQINYRFKGIRQGDEGDALVTSIANRYLERFSTPIPELTVETNFEHGQLIPGDKVFVDSDFIPSSAGTKSFSHILEVIKRTIDPVKGTLSFVLAFTRYTGRQFRIGFISPSPLITAINGNTITINGDSGLFFAGFKVRAGNKVPLHTILTVNGPDIELDTVTGIAVGDILSFGDLDEVVQGQKVYGFINDIYEIA